MDTAKKKDLKFLIFFLIILSFSLFYLFQSSYAKYRKQVDGNVSARIAGWNIKINNEDIANKKVLTSNIAPTFPETENTVKDVLAPGSEGYYTITIDATNVDVAFQYTIFSEVADTSSVTDLKTLSYIINPDNATASKLEYDPATGISGSLDKNAKTLSIRIYIKWEDEDGVMTNEEDTSAAINATKQALMKVKLQFSQINK